MAIIWSNGWETGDPAWSWTVGSGTVVTTAPQYGTYCYATTATVQYMAKSFTLATAPNPFHTTMYFKIAANPPADKYFVMFLTAEKADVSPTVSAYYVLLENSAGVPHVRMVASALAGATVTYSGSLTAGVWHKIEVEYYSAASGYCTLWVDGILAGTVTGDSSLVPQTLIAVGNHQSAVIDDTTGIVYSPTLYIDTVSVSSAAAVTTGTITINTTQAGSPVSAGITINPGSITGSTNASGTYTSAQLAFGTYTVTATLGGTTLTYNNIVISASVPNVTVPFDFVATGYVTINAYQGIVGDKSTPVAATVTLNGTAGQTATPTTFIIPVGTYALTGIYGGQTQTVTNIAVTAANTSANPVVINLYFALPATVTITVTGNGTTVPVAGVHTEYNVGDTFRITATATTIGWQYQKMRRNGIDWTTANPGEFLNLAAVENIEVVFVLTVHQLAVNSNPISGVNFTVNGGTQTTPYSQSLQDGSYTIVMPATSGTYKFQQWQDGNTNATRTISLTADTTLTATYQLIIHNLVIISNPVTGIPVTINGTIYYTNTNPIPFTEGYITASAPSTFVSGAVTYGFLHWEDGTTNPSRAQFLLNADKTITATYGAINPTLSLVKQGPDGFVSANPAAPYNVGQPVTITAWVADIVNYKFVKWVNEDGTQLTDTNGSAQITMDANHTKTAVFQDVTHPTLALTVEPAGSGTITAIDLPPYSVGQSVRVQASASGIYQLIGWKEDGILQGLLDAYPLISISLDQVRAYTLTAVFAPKQHNLTISLPAGLSITVDGSPYTTASSPLILLLNETPPLHTVIVPTTYTATDGPHVFQQWEDGSTSTTRYVSLTADKTITGTYPLVMHNLTLNSTPITGVTITVGGTPFQTNRTIPLTAASYSVTASSPVTSMGGITYIFRQWLEDGITTATKTVDLSTGDKTITAVYTIAPHLLIITSTPITGIPILVDDTATYYTNTQTPPLPEGSHKVTAPQIVQQGQTTYAFAHWDDGSTTLSRTFQLTADRTVTATYTPIKPTLTLISSPAGAGSLTKIPDYPSYDLGETVVIKAAINDTIAYSWGGWTNEDGTPYSQNADSSVILNVLVNGSYNRTLTANFNSISYATLHLIANPTEGGTIAAQESSVDGAGGYNIGQDVHVTATPAPGYQIGGWLEDGAGVSAYGTNTTVLIHMDQSHTLTANFVPVTSPPTPNWLIPVAVALGVIGTQVL